MNCRCCHGTLRERRRDDFAVGELVEYECPQCDRYGGVVYDHQTGRSRNRMGAIVTARSSRGPRAANAVGSSLGVSQYTRHAPVSASMDMPTVAGLPWADGGASARVARGGGRR